ncbi:MAG TPA: fumarylacetoacetate hydrolase family protein [Candidatus Dormibacteraeota bacterium]|nr:fumarylacetoacetate hydrolase family protein [Candidatus Dormibacteraeota bacterium]
MRFAVVPDPRDTARTRAGVLAGGRLHLMPGVATIAELLGDDGERLRTAGESALRDPDLVLDEGSVRLLPPVATPPSLRDFYAFEAHVAAARRSRGLEMEPDWYELPVFYFSNPRAVVGDGDDVAGPPGSAELDYELEVAAVVGRGGRDLSPDEAEERIAGYCVMNDWSARDLQRREMRLSMGPVKGKDFATTLGPMLVTPDELADRRSGRAFDLAMTARVNGVEWSRASLADIFWSFGEMLAYASRGTEVATGDVLGSGTCGTGCILELSLVHGAGRYPWLRPGDVVELAVERLGSVRNRVVEGLPLRPLRAAPAP